MVRDRNTEALVVSLQILSAPIGTAECLQSLSSTCVRRMGTQLQKPVEARSMEQFVVTAYLPSMGRQR